MITLITAVGLNPLRVLRCAHALSASRVLALTTPQTDHVVPAIEAAAARLGLGCEVLAVMGDGYRFEVTVEALRGTDLGPVEDLHWIVAGGTKPMIAAQAVVAEEVGGTVWLLDDRAGELRDVSGGQPPVALTEPETNLHPEDIARLHAGLDAEPDPDYVAIAPAAGAGEHGDLEWLLKRLTAPSHRYREEDPAAIGRRAERAVMHLVRECLPPSFAVHGSLTVDLRDPLLPDRPAMVRAAGRRLRRTFELDGVVVRGTRVWCVENKFARLTLGKARVAAAELDARRRHFGGDAASGVLVVLGDDIGERFPSGLPDFDIGSVRVLTGRHLIEAAHAVLASGAEPRPGLGIPGPEVAATSVARAFTG